ncbi:DegT/DnrJ/EryC1/StrS family aminotransferase [Rhodophyticola porphyridii]|uniref:DegT/DnrJ/EryC1/StrS family aminotransferase n=1 Tax=Rhodophyticola porphyridii TaxID=1852017 RepID=A0A3L9Y3I4_9RHOB|nr:DegT/DnrJ/EryC1/StrS family aminotransferase [Rhodophyticola porphyridii]RMA40666.1 DegT/DnrJ/EryC1/StrS family aminotransferase [Rhodophyticola porphyridii]
MTDRIAYTKPSITDLEVAYATDAARTGWGNKCYDYITKFEEAFAAHLGVPHAIATSSCTGALHMGFAALGIGPGDEVILADTNWIASVAPIVHLGGTPVFVDVDPTSWCLDPDAVEAAITPKTRAILAVHIYGNLCDMDRLHDIAARHRVHLVEDAAEAIGSVYRGQRAGAMGVFGTFSFHGTKTITTGEGGMFVTSDPDLYNQVLTLSNHGRTKGDTRQFWPVEVGFKYKMSNIEAAIGLGQIERVETLTHRKREILEFYRSALLTVGGMTMNPEPPDGRNGAWMPTVVFAPQTGITRDRVISAMKADGIDARIFFEPLSSLTMFEDAPQNSIARDLATRAINLPSFHDMTAAQQERVVRVVLGCMK